jgi:uroporphyrinogen III methyltransferase / synthase
MMVRIGTRGSALARWQAGEVARRLRLAGIDSEQVIIRTTGDRRTDVPLSQLGGKGLFLKEIEEALLRDEIDIAVHSLKDVPSFTGEQFALAAFLPRAEPRDAWIARDGSSLAELPAGAVVGTSSPRRRAQLLRRRPDLDIRPIRGNVDSRLAKLHAGEFDAIILAGAGLERLGRLDEITTLLSLEEMLPASGQAIVTIETRADRPDLIEMLRSINDPDAELMGTAERSVLQRFGSLLDCHSSIAVHASLKEERLTIRAIASDPEGRNVVEGGAHGAREEAARLIAETWQQLVDTGARELLTLPASERSASTSSGRVYLVGAGPGDPGLLTLRAAELIATADVVVLDALVSPEIAARIPETATILDAGKRASRHKMTQEEINAALVEHGLAGRRVVRLKGGDPFVFGRGGEEAEELREAGVEFEIVPGISSAIAGPAYAGIPVTHRSFATAVTLVTGHESDESKGIAWKALAGLDGTIVFLMGLSQLESIAGNLIAQGRDASTPVAVISRATTPRQRSVSATLATIAEEVRQARIEAPALIVVGGVVSLRDRLNWFERRPLHGRTIIVTRARNQSSSLAALLSEAGATVKQFPAIEIHPPSDSSSLDRVIGALETYDWLIFTSSNGVEFFFERLLAAGGDARRLSGRRIAAVGKPTADDLRRRGIVADLVPDRFQSAALLPLLEEKQQGIRTAVIRAARGSDELLDGLRSRGGEVDLAVAYETRGSDHHREEINALLQQRAVDAITFTSGSTVDHFLEQLGDDPAALLDGATLASIGPLTTAALQKHGLEPHVEAEAATVEALASVLIAHLSR